MSLFFVRSEETDVPNKTAGVSPLHKTLVNFQPVYICFYACSLIHKSG